MDVIFLHQKIEVPFFFGKVVFISLGSLGQTYHHG